MPGNRRAPGEQITGEGLNRPAVPSVQSAPRAGQHGRGGRAAARATRASAARRLAWLTLPCLTVLVMAMAVPNARAAHAPGAPESAGTTLEYVLIFGRHGVRSPVLEPKTLTKFASGEFPDFGVPPGYLTAHGRQAETLLGAFFRQYLLHEHLLTGNAAVDAPRVYVRANSNQRSNRSASAFVAGLLPDTAVPIHSYPLGTPDGLFDPVGAGVVRVDTSRAVREVQGLVGSEGTSLARAFSSELALIRSVLFGYSRELIPAPVTPNGHVDPTGIPVTLTASRTGQVTGNIIDTGGLASTLYAADPFVMEYTDGMPMSQVGWGRLSADQLSEQTRIITGQIAIEMSPPYLNRLQSSNAAAHLLRSLEQAVTRQRVAGALGTRDTRIALINSSDAYVVGLAALLQAHWLIPGYQPDYCPPGGSLVFELRRGSHDKRHIVRVYFTAQTFDQLRELAPLDLANGPASMQLLIPGTGQAETLDVDLGRFLQRLQAEIDFTAVSDPRKEKAPGELGGVPSE